MAKGRKFKGFSAPSKSTARRAALDSGLERADRMIDLGQFEEAMTLLLPLADEFPRDVDVQSMLGICYLNLDDPDTAADHLERAYTLGRQPELWLPLGIAYYQMTMIGSSLHAFQEAERLDAPLSGDMQQLAENLRRHVGQTAQELNLPFEKALIGLRDMERSQRWLERGDFSRAVQELRASIRALGDSPSAHNLLAQALYFHGEIPAAIAEVKGILAKHPENLAAACNLVRILAWSGEQDAAAAAWQPLRMRTPATMPIDALQLGETAAVMNDDASVRQFLGAVAGWTADDLGSWALYAQVQRFLVTAEANLGDIKAAKRRLRAFKSPDDGTPDDRLEDLREAIGQGERGSGLIDRFPYYYSNDLLPPAVRDELVQLLIAAADNERKSAAQFKRFATRYPPLAVMAEKAIWEEGKIEFGLLLLRYIASPTAHAALRRFAGSQAGSEEDRMSALLALQLSGGATPGEKFRVWLGGEWHEIELRNLTIILQRDPPFHNAKARKLVEQSSAAVSERRWADVVTLMRQLIDLEPRAYEALNNLAAALDELGDEEGSRAALEQALAIRPQYLHARVNLALKTADQDPEAAAAYLEPLQKQTEFTTEEFALYQYGLARVAFVRGEYSAARSILHMGLSVDPDYDPALDLLEDIAAREFAQGIGRAANELKEYFGKLNDSYRQRQQKKLKTVSPAIDDMIGLYSADLLRPMVRALAPDRKLTGLRKADLQHLVRDLLLDNQVLSFIVHQQLRAVEREALQAVLAEGGAMPLEQFRRSFGDDADESPWWGPHDPTSIGGRLRLHGLLVETTGKDRLYIAVPVELRAPLARLINT